MKGRPPKKTLTRAQEQAAAAFVAAAEPAQPAPTPRTPVRPAAPTSSDDLPWTAPHVREDVVKGYALRLPEPLYLKLKHVADVTGRSMNRVCRDAIERAVAEALAER